MFAVSIFTRPAAALAGALLLGFVAPSPASAQKAIGETFKVENSVTGTLGARTRDLGDHSEVFVNDVVKTKAASLARVTFEDDTNLAIGPASEVKLDRFVYNPDKGAQKVVLSMGRGAFRFVTGDSDPRAFRINTPVASVGVRGTVLDIKNEAARSIVVLEQGGSLVCMKSGARCVALVKPDQYAIVTRTSIQGPLEGGRGAFSFAALCSGGAICGINKVLKAAIPETPKGRCFAAMNGLAKMPALMAIEKAQSAGPSSPSQSTPKDPC